MYSLGNSINQQCFFSSACPHQIQVYFPTKLIIDDFCTYLYLLTFVYKQWTICNQFSSISSSSDCESRFSPFAPVIEYQVHFIRLRVRLRACQQTRFVTSWSGFLGPWLTLLVAPPQFYSCVVVVNSVYEHMLFLHADTSIFVLAHLSISPSLCVYLFYVVYICHVNSIS